MLEARCHPRPAGQHGQTLVNGTTRGESPLCKDDLRSYVDGIGNVLACAVLEVRRSAPRCLPWLPACWRSCANEDASCKEQDQLSFATAYSFGTCLSCKNLDTLFRTWLQRPAGAALRAAARCAISRTPCYLEVKLPGSLCILDNAGGGAEAEQTYQIKSCVYDDGISPHVPALVVMQSGAPGRVISPPRPTSGSRLHMETGLWPTFSAAQSSRLFDATTPSALPLGVANLAVEGAACCVTLLQYPSGMVLFQNPRSKGFAGDVVGKPLGGVFLRQLLSDAESSDAGNPLEAMLQALEAGKEFEVVVQVPATLGDLERVAERRFIKDSGILGTIKHMHLQRSTSALTDLFATDEDGGQDILDTEDRILLEALTRHGSPRGRWGGAVDSCAGGSGSPAHRRRVRRSASLHEVNNIPARSPTSVLAEALQRPVQSISRVQRACSQRTNLTSHSRAASFSVCDISNGRASGLRTMTHTHNLPIHQPADGISGAVNGYVSGRSRLAMANNSSLYHSEDFVFGPRSRPEMGLGFSAAGSSGVSAAVEFLGLPKHSTHVEQVMVSMGAGAVRDGRVMVPLSQRQHQSSQNQQSQQEQRNAGGSRDAGILSPTPLVYISTSALLGATLGQETLDRNSAAGGCRGTGSLAGNSLATILQATPGIQARKSFASLVPGISCSPNSHSTSTPPVGLAFSVAGGGAAGRGGGGFSTSGDAAWAFVGERDPGSPSWGPANGGDVSIPMSASGTGAAPAVTSQALQPPIRTARTAPAPWEGRGLHRPFALLSRMGASTAPPRSTAGQLTAVTSGSRSSGLMGARYSSPPAVHGQTRRHGSVVRRAATSVNANDIASTDPHVAVTAPNTTVAVHLIPSGWIQPTASGDDIVRTRVVPAVQGAQGSGPNSQSSTMTRPPGLDSLTLATLSVVRQTDFGTLGRDDSTDQHHLSQPFQLQTLVSQQLRYSQDVVYSAGSSRLGRDAARAVDFMPHLLTNQDRLQRMHSTPMAQEPPSGEHADLSEVASIQAKTAAAYAANKAAEAASPGRQPPQLLLMSPCAEMKRHNSSKSAKCSVSGESIGPGGSSPPPMAALSSASVASASATPPNDLSRRPGGEASTPSRSPPLALQSPTVIGSATSPAGGPRTASQLGEVGTPENESHLLFLGAINDEAPAGEASTLAMQGLTLSVSMHTGDCTGLQSTVTTATGPATTSTLIIPQGWHDLTGVLYSPHRSSNVRRSHPVPGAMRPVMALRGEAAGSGHHRRVQPSVNVKREAETTSGGTNSMEPELCLPAAYGSLPPSPYASHPSLLRSSSVHICDTGLSPGCGGGLRGFRPMVTEASHHLPGLLRGAKLLSSSLATVFPSTQLTSADVLSVAAITSAASVARSPTLGTTAEPSGAVLNGPLPQAQQPATMSLTTGGPSSNGSVAIRKTAMGAATAAEAMLPHRDTHTATYTSSGGVASGPMNAVYLVDGRRCATVDGVRGEPTTGFFSASHESTYNREVGLGAPPPMTLRGMRQHSRRSVPLRSQGTVRRLTRLLNSFSSQSPHNGGSSVVGTAASILFGERPGSSRQQQSFALPVSDMGAAVEVSKISAGGGGPGAIAVAAGTATARCSAAAGPISSAVISSTARPQSATAAVTMGAAPRRMWHKVIIHSSAPSTTPADAAMDEATQPIPLGRDGGSCASAIPLSSFLCSGMGSRAGGNQNNRPDASAGGIPGSRALTLTVTQIDVTEQVEAQAGLRRLLEQEHKLLEGIFPRHVIEYLTLQEGARPVAAAAASGAGGSSLFSLVPGSVERMASLATWHPGVTILFADCVGFTSMCHVATPLAVMAFLNQLYSRFDHMIDIFKVYKVETIGDCYMVAGGLVAYDDDGYKSVISGAEDLLHAVRVMEFAKVMLRASREVRMPDTGEPVKMRIGLHSGPVTSGVVGDRMPRFCVFGDTVNVASRMESTCRPGCIHVSASTQARLPNEAWRDLGMTAVKGKGEMRTFEWAGDVDAPVNGGQIQRVIGLYL